MRANGVRTQPHLTGWPSCGMVALMSDSAIHPVLHEAVEQAPRGAGLPLKLFVLGSRAQRLYTKAGTLSQDVAAGKLRRMVRWAGTVDRAAVLMGVPGPTVAGWHERRYRMNAAARSLVCLVSSILRLDELPLRRRRNRSLAPGTQVAPTSANAPAGTPGNAAGHPHAADELSADCGE